MSGVVVVATPSDSTTGAQSCQSAAPAVRSPLRASNAQHRGRRSMAACCRRRLAWCARSVSHTCSHSATPDMVLAAGGCSAAAAASAAGAAAAPALASVPSVPVPAPASLALAPAACSAPARLPGSVPAPAPAPVAPAVAAPAAAPASASAAAFAAFVPPAQVPVAMPCANALASGAAGKSGTTAPQIIADVNAKFRLFHLNVNNLDAHLALLDTLLALHDFHEFVAITETHLCTSVEELNLTNYRAVSRRDRADQSGWGGIALYARHDVHMNVVHMKDSESLELSWYTLHSDVGPLLIGVWYRPPRRR